MTTIRLDNLAQHGWQPDVAPNSAPNTAWTLSNNWLPSDKGYMVTPRGYLNGFGLKKNRQTLLKNGTFLYPWTDLEGQRTDFYISDDGDITLVTDSENNLVETILKTVTAPEAVKWDWNATDTFSRPIFNNGRDAPYTMLSDSDVEFLPKFPFGHYCDFFTTYKENFLVAVGYQGLPQVFISDAITSPGAFPTWGTTAYSGYASNGIDSETITPPGETFSKIIDLSILTSGDLVDAKEVNDILYIFTTVNILAIRYEGSGNFSATVFHSDNGVLGRNCVAVIPNGFYCVGNNQHYIVQGGFSEYEGTQKQVIGDGIWTESWYNTLYDNRIDEVQAVYDGRTQHVFLKTPVTSLTQEIWRYDLKLNAVGKQTDMAEIRWIVYSQDGLPASNVTIDTLPSDWTIDTIPFTDIDELPIYTRGTYQHRIISLGGSSTAPTIFIHDFGSDYNGRPIEAVLRKDALVLKNNAIEHVGIERVIPYTSTTATSGTLRVSVGAANIPHQEPTFNQNREFNIMTGTKVDFRVNSRYPALRFETTVSGLSLHAIELDIKETDRR